MADAEEHREEEPRSDERRRDDDDDNDDDACACDGDENDKRWCNGEDDDGDDDSPFTRNAATRAAYGASGAPSVRRSSNGTCEKVATMRDDRSPRTGSDVDRSRRPA